MTADLTWLRDFPGRCPDCLLDESRQGHRSPCEPSGPLGVILGRKLADRGMARTTAAHPDDASRVDEVLERFIRSGRPFSANDTRPFLVGVKGSVIGSRWNVAARTRIKRTGRRFPSTDPGTHAHRIDEWIAA